MKKKWVVVDQKDNMKADTKNDADHTKQPVCPVEKKRHEVEVIWCEEQKQRLARSLLGVNVNPIEFRKVIDVGPFRCLITFDSPEIRDAALKNELLLSTFDEVRRHWEIFWGLSRRVWIEIMGIPVGLWCTENINRIVKHWGKVVRFDDRTEESKSYSTARVLLDCFQWESIHEWVTIKVDDRQFEVFVKEFGSEMYSVQSHPNLGFECWMSSSNKLEASGDERMPTEVEQSQVIVNNIMKGVDDEYFKKCNCGDDPIVEAIMMKNRESVESFNYDSFKCSVELSPMKEVEWRRREECRVFPVVSEWSSEVGSDPMLMEAHYAWNCLRPNKGTKNVEVFDGPKGVSSGPVNEPECSTSCPYPPGYGPCTDFIHVHRVVPETCADIVDDGVVDSEAEEELSDETLYLINEDARIRSLFLEVGDDSESDPEAKKVVENRNLVNEGSEDWCVGVDSAEHQDTGKEESEFDLEVEAAE
ncbi:hypothetical protein PIB30_086360 [Stylosanthes scabra]|uniref:DUF4283 domain-containing protein n=1 Tax=Stylosanthes scabra TaxID=79078 RepID=A0ABU6XU75_9FABA|nr:hypothetical protein [Stylosanthes scabra]